MNNRPFDLLSLGELLLRLSPSANERLVRGDTFQKQVGGAEMNVAVGASLLGLHTGVITKLPANDMGNFIKNKIRSYGISDDYFVYDKMCIRDSCRSGWCRDTGSCRGRWRSESWLPDTWPRDRHRRCCKCWRRPNTR